MLCLLGRRRRDWHDGPVTQPNRGALVVIPTYNEAENIELSSTASAPPFPTLDVLVVDDESPDGTGEIADKIATHDVPGPCAPPPSQGRARSGLPGGLRVGAGARLRRRSSRWTPTGHTCPSSCLGCWTRCPRLTSCWVHAGCAVAGSSTGRSGASCCRAVATRTPGSRWVCLCATPRVASALSAATTLGGDRPGYGPFAGLLLPGRPRPAVDRGGLSGRGGTDHVRRTRLRRVEDDGVDRPGGAGPGHPVGRSASPRPAARGGGRTTYLGRALRCTGSSCSRCSSGLPDPRDLRDHPGRAGDRRDPHGLAAGRSSPCLVPGSSGARVAEHGRRCVAR